MARRCNHAQSLVFNVRLSQLGLNAAKSIVCRYGRNYINDCHDFSQAQTMHALASFVVDPIDFGLIPPSSKNNISESFLV
jgi:hypothetical protein